MLDTKSIVKLLEAYGSSSLSVDKFSDEYLKLFAAIGAGEFDRELFHIFEDIFEDIDAYSPVWTLEDEEKYPYRITEATLRVEMKKSLFELKKYLSAF